MAKPYMTSTDILNAIKRKIAVPISQVTFSQTDLLAFANEEMMISQVPSVLEFHEEYFVVSVDVPLISDVLRYAIPDRAIGMKLRDVSYKNEGGDVFDMTRVSADDKTIYQRGLMTEQQIQKYYLEGNDVVLLPAVLTSATGSLVFSYFQRPNQLVLNEDAAIVTAFVQTITVSNASIVAGDTVTIEEEVFTAVAGAPAANEFQIGGSSIITATNLATSINTNGVVTASNGSPSTAVVTLSYSDVSTEVTSSNSAALTIPSEVISIQFDNVPSIITNRSVIDFLQTLPGHRSKRIDITIPSNGVSGDIITFVEGDVPQDLIIGDYICLANECIIPQIPPDLHISLVERTCGRILASLGDTQGVATQKEKIEEVDRRQGMLLDNRVEGSSVKIVNRYSHLRSAQTGSRRRL